MTRPTKTKYLVGEFFSPGSPLSSTYIKYIWQGRLEFSAEGAVLEGGEEGVEFG